MNFTKLAFDMAEIFGLDPRKQKPPPSFTQHLYTWGEQEPTLPYLIGFGYCSTLTGIQLSIEYPIFQMNTEYPIRTNKQSVISNKFNLYKDISEYGENINTHYGVAEANQLLKAIKRFYLPKYMRSLNWDLTVTESGKPSVITKQIPRRDLKEVIAKAIGNVASAHVTFFKNGSVLITSPAITLNIRVKERD